MMKDVTIVLPYDVELLHPCREKFFASEKILKEEVLMIESKMNITMNKILSDINEIKAQKQEIIEKRKGMTKKEQRLNHLDTLFYDVSNDALKQGIKDVYNSFIRYFKKISKKSS